jgi:hypothetical protein
VFAACRCWVDLSLSPRRELGGHVDDVLTVAGQLLGEDSATPN